LGSNRNIEFTIWIDTPAYTGLGDTVFDKDNTAEQKTFPVIPEGSTIKASVSGLWGPAWVKMYVDDERLFSEGFEYLEDDSYMAEIKVPSHDLSAEQKKLVEKDQYVQNGNLRLRNLVRNFVDLKYTYRPDETPILRWSDENVQAENDAVEETEAPIEPLENPDKFAQNIKKDLPEDIKNFGMNFPLTMQDDYGVKSIEVHLQLPEDFIDKPVFHGEKYFIKPMSTAAGAAYTTTTFFDLSAHPYAGLPVEITIKAIDDAGQTAETSERIFTLNERTFSQLLAQRLVNLRKKLIWEGIEAAKNVSFDLRFQLQYPEDMRDDPSIWLALKNVKRRLENAKSNEDIEPLIETLWTIALDLEDMGLSKAARELERITSKMTRALRSEKTSDEEKLELFDEYREKMATYLDKLREFNENRDTSAADLNEELMKDLLNPGPLQEMLDQMEILAENGDYDSLEDMIADLQALLESFALGGAMPPELQAMQKGLDVMQGLVDNQKHLLSETEELAKRIPESVKRPQKGFGEIMPAPEGIFEEWFQGDIPPPPSAKNELFLTPRPETPEPRAPLGPGQIPIPEDFGRDTPDLPPPPLGRAPALPQPPMDNNAPQSEWADNNNELEIYDDTLPDTWEEANIQEVLRFILGDVMGEIYNFTDKLPETMPLAELEMRKSTRTLDDDRPDESVPVQEEVIRLLEQAQEELQKQMQEEMQKRAGGQGSGVGSRFRPRSTDPLGRPTNPEEDENLFAEDSEVEVPDSFDKRRIDEILEYLRKNSGDPDRTQIEREYFRRLLKQF
jgi:hypothetical protein